VQQLLNSLSLFIKKRRPRLRREFQSLSKPGRDHGSRGISMSDQLLEINHMHTVTKDVVEAARENLVLGQA
jgi:hypothetical protein